MSLVFITGGVRSGKSRFGETLADGSSSVLYIATGMVSDSEMEKRVRLHQERRPSHWDTMETPNSLLAGLKHYMDYDSVLIDCLSTWVSNLLLSVSEEHIRDTALEDRIQTELNNWLETVRTLPQMVIVISNEVGLGGVAISRLGRWFQDVLGEANQTVAQSADEVYTVFSGIPVRIKP